MRPTPPAAYGDDISCVETLCASSRALLRSCILLSFLSCPKPRCCRPSRRRHPPRCCRSSCRRLRPGCLPSGDCLRVPVRNYVRTYVRISPGVRGEKRPLSKGLGSEMPVFPKGVGWKTKRGGLEYVRGLQRMAWRSAVPHCGAGERPGGRRARDGRAEADRSKRGITDVLTYVRTYVRILQVCFCAQSAAFSPPPHLLAYVRTYFPNSPNSEFGDERRMLPG